MTDWQVCVFVYVRVCMRVCGIVLLSLAWQDWWKLKTDNMDVDNDVHTQALYLAQQKHKQEHTHTQRMGRWKSIPN